MNWFPLPIFPEGSLACSVVTTVWVGVVVFSLFNLRFGWVYSGLVVPGYLIPLAIEKPWVAVVVVCEAILTLWTVKAAMALLPRLGLGCELFGRDRFFAMIVASAFYRLAFDVWLLPALGGFLTEAWGIAFDYENTLHSFGLIVVCLLANQLFKTGVIKGAIPFCTVMGVTYLIIRFGLMELTNFNISSLSFLYEDVAASIYAAPKAYIILITAGIIASLFNLRYGWDFNGIMIPALLSIQWYEPMKIFTSIVEALFILQVSVLLMKMPPFNKLTIEGSRKVMFFFTVSFAYKMLIGWGLCLFAPEVKSSDYYGFGYLLPTLMAIKMHALNKVVHQVRITVQVSLLSVAAANVIGIALTFLPTFSGRAAASERAVETDRQAMVSLPTERAFYDSLRELHRLEETPPDSIREIELSYHFAKGLDLVFLEAPSREKLCYLMDRAKCEVVALDDGSFLVRSRIPGRPGFHLLNPSARTRLTIEIPGALENPGLPFPGLDLYRKLDARILSIYGGEESAAATTPDPLGRMIRNRHSPEGLLRLLVTRGDIVLYVTRKIPSGLSLPVLEKYAGSFETRWESAASLDVDRASTFHGFSELALDPIAIKTGEGASSVAEFAKNSDRIGFETEDFASSATGLYSFVREFAEPVAAPDSNLYQPPAPGELRLIEETLLKPVWAASADQLRDQAGHWQRVAGRLGFELLVDGDYLCLRDSPASGRHWGGFLMRIGEDRQAREVLYQIPSRSFDGSLLGFAATRFQRERARLLAWSGSSSLSNTNGESRFTVFENRGSFFNLVHQSYLANRGSQSSAIVQLRSLVPAPDFPAPRADLVLALDNRTISLAEAKTRIAPLRRSWTDEGFRVENADPSGTLSHLALGPNLQAGALVFSGGANVFGQLWVFPNLRRGFVPRESYEGQLKQIRALDIPLREMDFSRVSLSFAAGDVEMIRQRVAKYRLTRDIVALKKLLDEVPGPVEAYIDQDTGIPCLCFSNADGQPILVASLAGFSTGRSMAADTASLAEWLSRRAGFLRAPETRK